MEDQSEKTNDGIRCLNCGNTCEGNFCPHCGQKVKTKRLKILEIVADFASSFVGGDNKFLRSCRDLLGHPGYMVRDYLSGKRIRYYNPLQFYVFIFTIYAIVAFAIGDSASVIDHISSLNLDYEETDSEYASYYLIINTLQRLYSNKLYGTLCTSFIAVFPFHRLFRKCPVARQDGSAFPLNHTEHFYAQMYFSCIQLIVSTFFLPICLIEGSDKVIGIVYQTVSLIFAVILFKQLHDIKWAKSIYKTILAYALSFISIILLLFVVLFIAALIEETNK